MSENLMIYLIGYPAVLNICSFVVYGIDKSRAQKGQYRISEKTLIILAAAGGSIGAWIGMWVYRHKTKHIKFYIGIPIIILLQAGIILWLLVR